MESNLNAVAWPFVLVEEVPLPAGFEFDDDRGPDMTGLCLKSATGAIPKSNVSLSRTRREGRKRKRGRRRRDTEATTLKRTETFPVILYAAFGRK